MIIHWTEIRWRYCFTRPSGAYLTLFGVVVGASWRKCAIITIDRKNVFRIWGWWNP